jgi:hypothetical protein
MKTRITGRRGNRNAVDAVTIAERCGRRYHSNDNGNAVVLGIDALRAASLGVVKARPKQLDCATQEIAAIAVIQ